MKQYFQLQYLARPSDDYAFPEDIQGEKSLRSVVKADTELVARRIILNRMYERGFLVSRFLRIRTSKSG
jgi:hypothetical protein